MRCFSICLIDVDENRCFLWRSFASLSGTIVDTCVETHADSKPSCLWSTSKHTHESQLTRCSVGRVVSIPSKYDICFSCAVSNIQHVLTTRVDLRQDGVLCNVSIWYIVAAYRVHIITLWRKQCFQHDNFVATDYGWLGCQWMDRCAFTRQWPTTSYGGITVDVHSSWWGFQCVRHTKHQYNNFWHFRVGILRKVLSFVQLKYSIGKTYRCQLLIVDCH